MNNFSSSLIGGITGAVGLNLLHQIYKQPDHDAPVSRTGKTKLLTFAWYTFGGLLAASVIKALRH